MQPVLFSGLIFDFHQVKGKTSLNHRIRMVLPHAKEGRSTHKSYYCSVGTPYLLSPGHNHFKKQSQKGPPLNN